MQIVFSNIIEESLFLWKIYIDTRKKEKILIKNDTIDNSKDIVSKPTHKYYNGAYMEETVHDIIVKIRQRKNNYNSQ